MGSPSSRGCSRCTCSPRPISVPIYGKLADMVGRKPIMLVGIGMFVVGSVLCGLAWSMPALIAFRVLQGLGAGAVQPMAMTIVGDLYTLAERAKVQGYIASVWAVSSVIGPTLGGLFVDYLSWRWIFFVNIPIGIAAAWALATVASTSRSPAAVTASTTPAWPCSPSVARPCCSACSRAASCGRGRHR